MSEKCSTPNLKSAHAALTFQTATEGEIVGVSWLLPPFRWMHDARAVDLVRAGVAALGGKGGGGRPDMAQGGGPDGAMADEAMAAIKRAIRT